MPGSDNAIDVIDFAQLTGGYSDSQEVKWQKSIVLANRGRSNPFHGLIGGLNGMKPITEVMDFKALAGKEIVVTLDRPLGGPGVQGPASQNKVVGNEENQAPWSYRAKVGLFAHMVAGEQIMETQTVIGGDWDSRQRKKLSEYFIHKQGDDIQMEMIVKAHARNTLYPNNKAAIDDLGTGDCINLGTVTYMKELMNANQAQPFDISRSGSGAEILSYLLMGPSKAFNGMATSNSYQQLLANADNRGDSNKLFKGGLPKWNGDYLFDWRVEDGVQIGPLAAPCAPVAYLAADLPATTTTDFTAGAGIFILGGGTQNTDGSKTKPLFFQYYENSRYVGHEGEKRAADTTTRRYLAMKILTGADTGKIALFSYLVNNGNKITISERLGAAGAGQIVTTLTGSTITYNGAGNAWTSAAGSNGFKGVSTGIIPAGSPIYQINAKGTPYVRSFGFGRNGIIAGYGNLAPNKAYGSGGGSPGQRLFQAQDAGRIFSVGWQQVWGCTATRDANDMVNAYSLIVSAFQPPGWPDVS